MRTTDRERLNVANKMADKKKNASHAKMVAPAPVAKSGEKEKEQSKTVKAVTRERDERKERESKSSGRSESKQTLSTRQRFRNNRLVLFVREAYRELRYKVTWPTFEEARNMTFVVIGLSLAVGLILWIADVGLFQLLQLINK
jgi:preprotein translocase SecE subunit